MNKNTKSNKEYRKKYRLDNKDRIKEWNKQYYLKNKERISENNKKYRLNNKEKIKELSKKYYLENKEKIKNKQKKYYKKYYLDNSEKIKNRQKKYRLNNKEKIKEYSKKYRSDNKNYFKEYYLNNKKEFIKQKQRYRLKHKTDPTYKITGSLRSRIYIALKKNRKSHSTLKLVGCSVEELWDHLEKQFKPGMTRDNYGLWHVDHIKPCISFDLTKPQEQAKCFHYTNLQPLWAAENLSKGAKYEME